MKLLKSRREKILLASTIKIQKIFEPADIYIFFQCDDILNSDFRQFVKDLQLAKIFKELSIVGL